MNLGDYSDIILWGANGAAVYASRICNHLGLRWTVVDQSPQARQYLFPDRTVKSTDILTSISVDTLVVICADIRRFGNVIRAKANRLGCSACIDYRSFCEHVRIDVASSKIDNQHGQGTNKNKIAIVIPRLAIGGAEQQALLLAAALMEAGKNAVLIGLSAAEYNQSAYIEKLLACGIKFVNLKDINSPSLLLDGFTSLLQEPTFLEFSLSGQHYMSEMYNWLREERPNAIISLLDEANMVCGHLSAYSFKIPTLLFFRSLSPLELSKENSNNQFCVDHSGMANRYKKWQQLQHINFAANAIEGRNSYAKWLNIPLQTIHHIPNIVKLQKRSPTNKSKSQVPHIIGLMRLSQEKAPEDFVRVLDALQQKGLKFKATVIGDGAMRAKVESLLKDNSLTHCTQLLGFITDPNKILQSADVIVQTSLIEGLPNALIEAQANGCLIVATDVGSTRDAIAHDYHQFLSDPRDINSLSDNIIKVLNNTYEEKQKLINAGYSHVAEHYSTSIIVDRTTALIN